MKIRRRIALGLLGLASWLAAAGEGAPAAGKRTPPGPVAEGDYFPIGVWLQDPRHAPRYREAGINLYVGLWRGPTAAQLDALRAAGMPVICAQNAVGLARRDDPWIVGWMHDDEPDNAQSLGEGKGYGPPILPERIVRDYRTMKAADPDRPVLLNLGQGVAWDAYIGRGVRRNHPEDYPEYLRGCDIASFDIYPVVHESPEVAGRLEFVARGVERLVGWSGGTKPVWNCIECTHIGNPRVRATPAQVRAEVWLALVAGSRGLIYFVHQFKPVFREAALLEDPEMLAAVTAINHQIHELAPVLNSPSHPNLVRVISDGAGPDVRVLVKRSAGMIHAFAVNRSARPGRATFELGKSEGEATVEVRGEERRIEVVNGAFGDSFEAYGFHHYAIRLGSRNQGGRNDGPPVPDRAGTNPPGNPPQGR